MEGSEAAGGMDDGYQLYIGGEAKVAANLSATHKEI